eukprot:5274525-Pyramimonas_sp.AAC.1
MPHDLAHEHSLARGVADRDVALRMRGLAGLRARMPIPVAGTSKPFLFARGGEQGDVETPDEWNCMTEYLLEPIVESCCPIDGVLLLG